MGVTKGKNYLKNIKRHIALDLEHPKHRGVRMQAHHVLSQEGIGLSRKGRILEASGYEIDSLENLSFIPCTLQGACHLGIQPHRGDHAVASDAPALRAFGGIRSAAGDEDNYEDDDHPDSYHLRVSRLVSNTVTKFHGKCNGLEAMPSRLVDAMHDLSRNLLSTIYGHPNEARLTSVADSFKLGNPVGCGGVDNVGQHDGRTKCPCERDHSSGRHHERSQKAEAIAYPANSHYTLRPRK